MNQPVTLECRFKILAHYLLILHTCLALLFKLTYCKKHGFHYNTLSDKHITVVCYRLLDFIGVDALINV